MPWVPKKPDRSGPHVAHHNWIHERVTGSPDNPMLIAGSGIVLSVNEHGQTTIRSTAVSGGSSGEKIRMLLCDAITGESKYYLVVAEVDPDQTPPA
jgi:hypothetical protein